MSTKARREALERYYRLIAHRLGVRGWHLSLEASDPPEEAEASTSLNHFEDTASLHVAPVVWSWPPERLRGLIAHEVLHLLFDRPLIDFAEAVRKVVPTSTVDAIEEIAKREHERMIEQFARSIAPSLPLPTLPDE